METRIIPGYELRGAHDLLPGDAKDLIRSAAPNAFLIGTCSFDDLEVVTVQGKRYVVVCRRSKGHVDETKEWLCDVDESKYIFSDRGVRNAVRSGDGRVQRRHDARSAQNHRRL